MKIELFDHGCRCYTIDENMILALDDVVIGKVVGGDDLVAPTIDEDPIFHLESGEVVKVSGIRSIRVIIG